MKRIKFAVLVIAMSVFCILLSKHVNAEEYDEPQQFIFFCKDRNGILFAVEYYDIIEHTEEQCAAECLVLGNKIVVAVKE